MTKVSGTEDRGHQVLAQPAARRGGSLAEGQVGVGLVEPGESQVSLSERHCCAQRLLQQMW